MKRIKKATLFFISIILLASRISSNPNVYETFGEQSKIAGTFYYLSGMAVAKTDASGNKVIFDRGQVRCVLDANGNLLSFSIYGTDEVKNWGDLKELISKKSGKSIEEVSNLMKGMDDNGNTQDSPKWADKAIQWLNDGINYSITISFGNGGASVVFSANGKEQKAYSFTGEEVGTWYYNPDGSLDKMTSISYEPCDKDTAGAVEKKIKKQDGSTESVYYKKVKTETKYYFGKAEEVYEITNPGEKRLVAKNIYDSGGSLIATEDYKNKEKTLYTSNKPMVTIAMKGNEKPGVSEGAVVRKWKYLENGAVDVIQGMDKSGKWNTTVFANGRAIMVVNGTGWTGEELRKAYNSIIENAINNKQEDIKSIAAKYGIVSIYIYNDQVSEWLKKYGEDKTNQIIANIFCWESENKEVKDASGNDVKIETGRETTENIISYQKKHGANGSQVAVTANYTSSQDSSLGMYVGSIVLFAYGNAIMEVNTNMYDPAVVATYVEMAKNVDWNALKEELKSNQNSLYDYLVQYYMDSQKMSEEQAREMANKIKDLLLNSIKIEGGVIHLSCNVSMLEAITTIVKALVHATDKLNKDSIAEKETDKTQYTQSQWIRGPLGSSTEIINTYTQTTYSLSLRGDAQKISNLCNNIFKIKIDFKANYTKTEGTMAGTTDRVEETGDSLDKFKSDLIDNFKSKVKDKLSAIAAAIERLDSKGIASWSVNKNININEASSGRVINYYVINRDPSITGQLTNIVEIDGNYYAVVKANYIDIFDGAGPQDAEGEIIYVEISDQLALDLKDEIGAQVLFSGDVREDVNGHLAITMNVAYGGGYRNLGNASKEEQYQKICALQKEDWYIRVFNEMKMVWSDIQAMYGTHSNWRQGFEFLRNFATGNTYIAPNF